MVSVCTGWTMQLKLVSLIGLYFGHVCSLTYAQVEPHPEAERALAEIGLQRDFGEHIKFHTRQIVTMATNERVQGLNGLMFMRGKGSSPESDITVSVQWFKERTGLLDFYVTTVKRPDFKLSEINGVLLWEIGETGVFWTDGEHYLVSLMGSPRITWEILETWLTMIPSTVAESEPAVEN